MSNQTIVSGETRRTRELWKTCCDAWDQEFRGIYERPDIVHNEEDFRAQFSALSSEFHGEDSNLNKSSFDNYHDDIHLFVRTIDKEVGLSPPSLKELFFTSAFAIVKVRTAWNHRVIKTNSSTDGCTSRIHVCRTQTTLQGCHRWIS